MTEEDFAAIERATEIRESIWFPVRVEVRHLVAEVRRLRAEVETFKADRARLRPLVCKDCRMTLFASWLLD